MISSLGLVKGLYFNSKRRYEICLKHNLIITNVFNNLQTIAYFSEEYNGKMRLMRGYIDGYRVIDDYLVGYLSTEYLKDQDLEKYKEENDKHGYFVINMPNKSIVSGLSKSEFLKFITNNLQMEELPDFQKLSPFKRVSCW